MGEDSLTASLYCAFAGIIGDGRPPCNFSCKAEKRTPHMTLPEQALRPGYRFAQEDVDDTALDNCRRAKAFEDRGLYDESAEELADNWPGFGRRPRVAALGERAAAEVLLRAGALTGWLGSSARHVGAQEAAKDLLTDAFARFEQAGERRKSAEVLVELTHCYWRQGSFDKARVMLDEADARLSDGDAPLNALLALRRALVEESAMRTHDALRTLTESAVLFVAGGGERSGVGITTSRRRPLVAGPRRMQGGLTRPRPHRVRGRHVLLRARGAHALPRGRREHPRLPVPHRLEVRRGAPAPRLRAPPLRAAGRRGARRTG